MTKAVFVRIGDGFYPVDDEGRAIVASVADGKQVMGEFKPSRNPRFHRMFFALLKLLVDNTEKFETVDQALLAIKIACHEVDTQIDVATGNLCYIPRSISFESMDEARFRRLFDRALYVITERWLIGTKADDLRNEVFAIVDGPQAIGTRVPKQRQKS